MKLFTRHEAWTVLRLTLLITLIGLGLLGAFGCGGATEDDDGFDDSELGVVEQAFSAPAAYGTEQTSGTQCIAPWQDGKCWVPKQKTNKYAQQCDGCDVDQTAGFLSGSGQFASALSGTGFSIPDAGGQPQNIFLHAHALGGFLETWLIGANTLDDKTSVDGKYKRFNTCEANVDFARIKADIAAGKYGSSCVTTSQCKQIVYANWVKHVLAPCVGLGRSTDGSSITRSTTTVPVAPATYSATEKTRMTNYQP